MQISRERIVGEIAKLNGERTQHLAAIEQSAANIHAVDGALIQCRAMLAIIDAPEPGSCKDCGAGPWEVHKAECKAPSVPPVEMLPVLPLDEPPADPVARCPAGVAITSDACPECGAKDNEFCKNEPRKRGAP